MDHDQLAKVSLKVVEEEAASGRDTLSFVNRLCTALDAPPVHGDDLSAALRANGWAPVTDGSMNPCDVVCAAHVKLQDYERIEAWIGVLALDGYVYGWGSNGILYLALEYAPTLVLRYGQG